MKITKIETNLNSQKEKKVRLPFYKTRLFFALLAFLIIVTLLTSTIGRDIYLGQPANIVSFTIIHFAGYLFFILLPVELAFMYFMTVYPSLPILLSITLATALTALSINYLSGYLMRVSFIELLIRPARFRKAQRFIKKYGGITIFISNALPFPSPLVVLAAGMLHYPFKKVLFLSFWGLFLKYLIISLFFV